MEELHGDIEIMTDLAQRMLDTLTVMAATLAAIEAGKMPPSPPAT